MPRLFRLDMRVLRWVFLAMYLVIFLGLLLYVLGVFVPDAAPMFWIVFAGVITACQAVFVFGAGTIQLCRPIRKRRLWMPVAVAALMVSALLGGAMLALGELLRVDGNDFFATAFLGGLVLNWVLWFTLLFVAVQQWPRFRVLTRLTGLVLTGSLLELVAAVPSHVIVSRRPACLVGLGTMTGIIAGVSVMIFSFGPAVALLFLRERYRNEIGESLCPKCHYDLRGNPQGTSCPECGTSLTPSRGR